MNISPNPIMGTTNPIELEHKCVHEVYEITAEHFDMTRTSLWPSVVSFIEDHSTTGLGADVGCGNGKYLPVANAHSEARCLPLLASDRSHKLANIVRQKGFDVIVADLLSLPYRPASFDFFICVAVIHHFCTEERRIDALKELAYLLRPGGRGLITVWAKEQHAPTQSSEPGLASAYLRFEQKAKRRAQKFKASASDSTPNSLSNKIGSNSNRKRDNLVSILLSSPKSPSMDRTFNLPIHVNGTEFIATDMLVPWHLKTMTKSPADLKNPEEVKKHNATSTQADVFHRYYHLFVQGELEKLVERVNGLLALERIYYDSGNWGAVVIRLTK